MADVQKAVDFLHREFGCERFLLAGGEPCLHSQFTEIMAYARSREEFSFGVVTNGTVYRQELVDNYLQLKNLEMQISLDGSCEEENAKTRGRGNFDKSRKMIEALTVSDRKPLIKMVVSQNNLEDVEPFYRRIVEMGGIPEFAFINKNGNGSDDWQHKYVTAQQKLQVLKTVDRLNEETGTKAFLPLCTGSCPIDDLEKPMSLLMKVDGSLQPCQLLYDAKFCVGNIYHYDREEIRDGMAKNAVMVAKRKEMDFGCSKCMMKYHCGKGCVAMADYLHGDPMTVDGECNYRKLQIVGFDIWKQGGIKKVAADGE